MKVVWVEVARVVMCRQCTRAGMPEGEMAA